MMSPSPVFASLVTSILTAVYGVYRLNIQGCNTDTNSYDNFILCPINYVNRSFLSPSQLVIMRVIKKNLFLARV